MADQTALGLVQNLIGKWVGTRNGWNVIAVPTTPTDSTAPVAPGTPANAVLGAGFQLEVQELAETVNVSGTARDSAPNKGGKARQQNSFGIEYDLTVTEVPTGGKLHFENGMWLNLADTPGGAPQFDIARQASIPHGNSALLLGTATASSGPPTIDPVSVIPIEASTGKPVTDAKYLAAYQEMTTKFADIFGPDLNPNKTLADAIAGVDIVGTVTFKLSTSNSGGIVNIPFGAQNAPPLSWDLLLWVETLKDGSVQMQYSQTILIEFFGIKWPHVDVNTLVRQ